MFDRFIAAITVAAVALCTPAIAAEGQTAAAPNYSEPLFTRRQTPICQTRDDLATFLGLLRSGRRELIEQVQGCMVFPIDGVPVVVLDQEGILDVWMRVRLMLRDGRQITVWTVGWMLRNDDSLPIAGDPAAGKVRICVNGTFEDAHVPALAMFKDGGILVGDLRDRWTQERFKPDTLNDHAAVVTTEAADLTKEKPCAEVGARMLVQDGYTVRTWPVSSGHAWDFDHVLGYPVAKLAQPGRLGLFRGQVALRAAVTADLGNPLTISEEEAARSKPENPLNRIPTDLQIARALPAKGATGNGNFRVCLPKEIDDPADGRTWSITVPPNVIFESYGRLIGDLRAPEPDTDYVVYDNKTSWAVITQTTFTLSRVKPCAVVPVRSVLSASWPWLFPLVRESDHLHFQALKVKGHAGTQGLRGHLGDALDGGMLNGTPVADIGNPLGLGDLAP